MFLTTNPSALPVDADIDGDAIQPGIKAGVPAEVLCLPEHLKENLLGDILGVLNVPGEPEANVQDLLMISKENILERIFSIPMARCRNIVMAIALQNGLNLELASCIPLVGPE